LYWWSYSWIGWSNEQFDKSWAIGFRNKQSDSSKSATTLSWK
jgi:hypothetical protein